MDKIILNQLISNLSASPFFHLKIINHLRFQVNQTFSGVLRRISGRSTRNLTHFTASNEILFYHSQKNKDTIRKYNRSEVLIEKAVDVMLAVDMVIMAERDEYDAAYLITADGDFTPAVNAVKSLSKKVYAVSLNNCWQLKRACNNFILLKPEWFTDCY